MRRRETMKKRLPVFFVGLTLVFLASQVCFGAVTGKISGTVRDGETGEALFPANIIVEETVMGAASRPEGDYFIINVPPGTYTVRAKMMGYRDVVVENVTVMANFTTTVDFALERTTVAVLEPITVSAERPLIQPDVTATTRFITSQDIENLPTRGYQEAAYLQTGVVAFSLQPDFDITDSESQNQPLLNIRGGRYNEVAYYVDGFSQQDPLTGLSSTAINQSAIQEVTVLTGGFNAEYGRIMSGAVNVITKEGGSNYQGSFEAVTDNLAGDWVSAEKYDYNVYDFSLGGPGLFLPFGTDQFNFYLSGERRWGRDRSPRSMSYGQLPSNSLSGWSWQGKLTFKPSPGLKFKIGTLGSYDDWHEFRNTYRFNSIHSPRYEDLNYSGTVSMTHTLSPSSFYTVAGSYFATDRIRGDGEHFDDVTAYARPGGNPRFGDYLNLFWNMDDPETDFLLDRQGTRVDGDEGHVWDDYLHRTASYWGLKFDYTSQINIENQMQFGFDFQRHNLRYYRHVLPVQVRLVDSTATQGFEYEMYTLNDTLGVDTVLVKRDSLWYETNPNSFLQDADYYGYYWAVTDSQLVTPEHWRISYTIEDGDTVGIDSTWCYQYYDYDYEEKEVDSGRQAIKHPITASAYLQDKFEYEGVVVNAGLRYDYLNVDTEALKDEELPLGEDGTTLDDDDLEENEVYHVFSPRLGIGFPISERTLFHANYGKFFQQPNLEDLYVSYDYLEYMIRWGPYYAPFGNPNLRPEKTTAYEVGIAHQIGGNARLDIVAYYKDVEDLVQVQNVPSQPNAFATYRNVDYGTIKGIDLGFSLARTSHVAANLAYSLSWATGTGSVSNTQYNIAWTGSEIPKMTTPLAFDQRHKISLNLDFRWDRDEGPSLGNMKLLQDAGLNLLINIGSGKPYTPTFIWNEVTLAAVSVTPEGPINSKYGPWTYQVDMKANKGFKFGRSNVDFYVWVINLFDRENAAYVYQSTGSADATGWLTTPEGEKWLADNGAQALEWYNLAQQNPNNFGTPRMVRFGIRTDF
jgi:outer membrane receptor protein involved in Fe transport